jgi:hypothetical protein
MYAGFHILTVIIVVLATIPSLAHALELPGKLRLDRETYFAVQRIYYPGFTIAGFAKPAGILAAFVLLLLTPAGTAAFWLALVALLSLVAMHLVYWVVTHPINRHWLKGEKLDRAGGGFFAADPMRVRERETGTTEQDWRVLRDRWEYSHVIRAAIASLSLLALVVALPSGATG